MLSDSGAEHASTSARQHASTPEGPQHGYAMTQDIEAMTGSRPGPGTLYGAISRLEARKWIEPLPADDRRRPYKLTSAGGKVLRARLDALKSVTKIALIRLANA